MRTPLWETLSDSDTNLSHAYPHQVWVQLDTRHVQFGEEKEENTLVVEKMNEGKGQDLDLFV
jgi:hypothetical protein